MQPGGGRGVQRGSALVELALVLPFIALLVLGTIDLGRSFRLTERLTNAAREGAAVAQFDPLRVNSGCLGTTNIVDRATSEDPGLASLPNYTVRVYKRDASTNALVPAGGITGCDSSSPGVTVAPGDRFVVEVSATMETFTPMVTRITGSRITLRGRQEVVMQG